VNDRAFFHIAAERGYRSNENAQTAFEVVRPIHGTVERCSRDLRLWRGRRRRDLSQRCVFLTEDARLLLAAVSRESLALLHRYGQYRDGQFGRVSTPRRCIAGGEGTGILFTDSATAADVNAASFASLLWTSAGPDQAMR
jgi:hypothetical protein